MVSQPLSCPLFLRYSVCSSSLQVIKNSSFLELLIRTSIHTMPASLSDAFSSLYVLSAGVEQRPQRRWRPHLQRHAALLHAWDPHTWLFPTSLHRPTPFSIPAPLPIQSTEPSLLAAHLLPLSLISKAPIRSDLPSSDLIAPT